MPRRSAGSRRWSTMPCRRAQRGATLTQRMLAFARRQELKPEAVDIPDAGRRHDRSAGALAGLQHQRSTTRFPPAMRPVLADATSSKWRCSTSRSTPATPCRGGGAHHDRGARTGARCRPTPSACRPGRYVVLSVVDNGEGMDEETLPRATEPFFTTKGVGKGTGLGLSMVHGLAEQSGGRLVLKSQPGEGTTAEPVAAGNAGHGRRPPRIPAPSMAPSAAAAKPLAILAVDDDALVLLNTAAMLDDQGHRVTTAYSGKEALNILRRGETFDLLITDQAMPGMTGAELIEIGARRAARSADRAGDRLRRIAARRGGRPAADLQAFPAEPPAASRQGSRKGLRLSPARRVPSRSGRCGGRAARAAGPPARPRPRPPTASAAPRPAPGPRPGPARHAP